MFIFILPISELSITMFLESFLLPFGKKEWKIFCLAQCLKTLCVASSMSAFEAKYAGRYVYG